MTRSEALHLKIQQELHDELCTDCADALCRSMAATCAVGATDLDSAEKAISELAELARRYLRMSWDQIKATLDRADATMQ